MDFYRLTFSWGLHPFVVHRAFLYIDEYQKLIKHFGLGPDSSEHGHDPDVCYGRSIAGDVPEVREDWIGQSVHIWPTGKMVPYRPVEKAA